jgi:hypothetical protein
MDKGAVIKSTVHRSGSRLDRLFITVPSWIRGL